MIEDNRKNNSVSKNIEFVDKGETVSGKSPLNDYNLAFNWTQAQSINSWKANLIIADSINKFSDIKPFPVHEKAISLIRKLPDGIQERIFSSLTSFAFGRFEASCIIGVIVLEFVIDKIFKENQMTLKPDEVKTAKCSLSTGGNNCETKKCDYYNRYSPGLSYKLEQLKKEKIIDVKEDLIDSLKKTEKTKHPRSKLTYNEHDANLILSETFILLNKFFN